MEQQFLLTKSDFLKSLLLWPRKGPFLFDSETITCYIIKHGGYMNIMIEHNGLLFEGYLIEDKGSEFLAFDINMKLAINYPKCSYNYNRMGVR